MYDEWDTLFYSYEVYYIKYIGNRKKYDLFVAVLGTKVCRLCTFWTAVTAKETNIFSNSETNFPIHFILKMSSNRINKGPIEIFVFKSREKILTRCGTRWGDYRWWLQWSGQRFNCNMVLTIYFIYIKDTITQTSGHPFCCIQLFYCRKAIKLTTCELHSL